MSSIGPYFVSNGLLFSVDAANAKSYSGSGTAWNDLGTKAYNLTLVNSPTYSAGTFAFNGSSQRADGADYAFLNFNTGNFTISFWMKPTAWADGSSRGIIDKKSGDGANGWTIYNDGTQPTKINARLGLQNNFFSTNAVTTNVWQNWVFMRSGSSIYWYLNGALDNTGTSSYLLNDTAILGVGYSKTWGGYFQGSLSNIAIYDRALTNAEISQNFNAARGRYGI